MGYAKSRYKMDDTIPCFIFSSNSILHIHGLKWIYERNLHFKRQRIIEKKIIELFRDKISRLDILKDIAKRGYVETSERNIIFWIALAIFPIFPVYYILHFLNEDFMKHETREDEFISVLNTAGINIPIRKYKVRKRSLKNIFF